MGKDWSINWWSNNSLVSHDSMLLTAWVGLKANWKGSVRDEFNIPKDLYIMGDSGGWQMASLKVNLDPKDVVNFGDTHCDSLMMLDYIPFYITEMKDEIRGSLDYFTSCMDKTAKNAEYYNKNVQRVKVYNVLQGDDPERMEMWWKKVIEPFPWRAISAAPWDTRPLTTTCMLTFLMSKGVKDAHFLGVGGWSTFPVMIYSTKYINQVTYDSKSWIDRAKFRNWTIPFQTSASIRFGYVNENIEKLEKIPCLCPACSKATPEYYQKDPTAISNNLIGLHHLYWVQQFTFYLEHMLRMEEHYIEFLPDEMKRCTEWIRDTVEDPGNWPNLYAKYWNDGTVSLDQWWTKPISTGETTSSS